MEPPAHRRPYENACQQSAMMLTFKNLNIPVAPVRHKVQQQFWSLWELSLTQSGWKLVFLMTKLNASIPFLPQRSCTLKELQSLIGTLNFACKVIPLGHPYLQRMIELTQNVKQPHHQMKLSTGFFLRILRCGSIS